MRNWELKHRSLSSTDFKCVVSSYKCLQKYLKSKEMSQFSFTFLTNGDALCIFFQKVFFD